MKGNIQSFFENLGTALLHLTPYAFYVGVGHGKGNHLSFKLRMTRKNYSVKTVLM